MFGRKEGEGREKKGKRREKKKGKVNKIFVFGLQERKRRETEFFPFLFDFGGKKKGGPKVNLFPSFSSLNFSPIKQNNWFSFPSIIFPTKHTVKKIERIDKED